MVPFCFCTMCFLNSPENIYEIIIYLGKKLRELFLIKYSIKKLMVVTKQLHQKCLR